MFTTGRVRGGSIRESFSKLRRQLSVRRNSKDSVLSTEYFSGVEVWEHSEDSSDESGESYSTSYSNSHAELSDDRGLENFLMPSRTLDGVIEDTLLTASFVEQNSVDQASDNPFQPFRFLDLPLEIRRQVYKHYFPQRGTAIRVKKSKTASDATITNPWQKSQPLLLTCREIYETAKEYSQMDAFTLDLSQYLMNPGEDVSITAILSQLDRAASQCSRLILSNDQSWGNLEPELFPSLRNVDIWDYGSWRTLFSRTDPYKLAADFEGESRTLLKPGAPRILAQERAKLPAGVAVQINLVCDLLVCVGSDDTQVKHDKLRHIFSFSNAQLDGAFTRLWARDHADMGRLPFACQIAQHMHLYCLGLREHEPELMRSL